MKVCANCGKTCEDKFKHCLKCGGPLKPVENKANSPIVSSTPSAIFDAWDEEMAENSHKETKFTDENVVMKNLSHNQEPKSGKKIPTVKDSLLGAWLQIDEEEEDEEDSIVIDYQRAQTPAAAKPSAPQLTPGQIAAAQTGAHMPPRSGVHITSVGKQRVQMSSATQMMPDASDSSPAKMPDAAASSPAQRPDVAESSAPQLTPGQIAAAQTGAHMPPKSAAHITSVGKQRVQMSFIGAPSAQMFAVSPKINNSDTITENNGEENASDEDSIEITVVNAKMPQHPVISTKPAPAPVDDEEDEYEDDDDEIEEKTTEKDSHSGLPYICKECGAIIQKTDRFCSQCGKACQNNATPASGISPAQKRYTPIYSQFELQFVNADNINNEKIELTEGENIIGTKKYPRLLSNTYISPEHLSIKCEGDKATIKDLNSKNGTFYRINAQAIELEDGDVFRIGEHLLAFHMGSSKQVILKPKDNAQNTPIQGSRESAGWGYLSQIITPNIESDVYRLSGKEILIGRVQGNIIFEDGFVSSRHARIYLNDKGTPILEDVGSSNGTFVRMNKEKTITGAIHLLVGDMLVMLCKKD